MKKLTLLKSIVGLLILVLAVSCDTNNSSDDLSIAPKEPADIVVKKGETGVMISWTAPNAGKLKDGTVARITGYTVEVATTSSFEKITKTVEVDGAAVSTDVEGLAADGITYYFRVRAKNASTKSEGENSSLESITLGSSSKASAPSAPTSVSAGENGILGTQATLIWTAPKSLGRMSDGITDSTIQSYKVEYSTADNFPKGDATKFVTVQETTATIIDLTLVTTYYVRVSAKNAAFQEFSDNSEVYMFTTTTPQAVPPGPPTNLLLQGEPKDIFVQISWTAPSNTGKGADGNEEARLIGYEIQYSLSEDFKVDTKIQQVKDETLTQTSVTGLTPNRRYFIRMRAINNNTEGESQSKSRFSIPLPNGVMTPKPAGSGSAAPPGEPTNITVASDTIGEDTAQVSWGAPTDNGLRKDGEAALILNYILEYADNTNFDNAENILIRALSITLTRLDVSTTYYVRVRAKNDNQLNGVNESQNTILAGGFSTKSPTPPSAPTDFEVNLKTGQEKTAATLEWSFSTENSGEKGDGTLATLQNFEIQYSSDDFREDINTVTPLLDPLTKMIDVTDLTPFTSYDFRIRAINDNKVKDEKLREEAVSKWSMVKSLMTTEDSSAPQPPTGVMVRTPDNTEEGRTKLIVSWTAPTDVGKTKNGQPDTVLNYIVEYTTQSSFPSQGSANVSTVNTEGDETTSTLTGLDPNTEYRIRVKTVNNLPVGSLSTSMYSTEAISRTNNNSIPPNTPTDLLISMIRDVSARIDFRTVAIAGKNAEGQNASLARYEYRVAPKSIGFTTSTPVITINLPGSNQVTFGTDVSGLIAETEYVLQVRSVSNNEFPSLMNSLWEEAEFTTTVTPELSITLSSGQQLTDGMADIVLPNSPSDSGTRVTVNVAGNVPSISLGTVSWSITEDSSSTANGSLENENTSTMTYISPTSFLETVNTKNIKIAVTSENYPDKTFIVRITRPAATGISISNDLLPETRQIAQGGEINLTNGATVVPPNAKQAIDWTVSPADAGSISENKFTAGSTDKQNVQLIATSRTDTTKSRASETFVITN